MNPIIEEGPSTPFDSSSPLGDEQGPKTQRLAPRHHQHGTVFRKLLQIFSKKTHEVEEPVGLIDLELEASKLVPLNELAILTGPTLHQQGICTASLIWKKDKGRDLLKFEVDGVGDDAKFTKLSLFVRVLESGT
jgi:hypothetical protein